MDAVGDLTRRQIVADLEAMEEVLGIGQNTQPKRNADESAGQGNACLLYTSRLKKAGRGGACDRTACVQYKVRRVEIFYSE